MRQFHARTHFRRVAVIDQRRAQMLADYRERYVDVRGTKLRELDESPRYRRLCGAAATYRMAGYLNPQEL